MFVSPEIPQQLGDLLERAEARELRRVPAAVVQAAVGVDVRELRVDDHLQRSRAPAVARAAGEPLDLRGVEARPAAVAVAVTREHAAADVGVDGLGLHAQPAGGLRGRQHPLMLMQSTLTCKFSGARSIHVHRSHWSRRRRRLRHRDRRARPRRRRTALPRRRPRASSRARALRARLGTARRRRHPTPASCRRRGRLARPFRRRARRPPGRCRDAGPGVGRRAADRRTDVAGPRRPRADVLRPVVTSRPSPRAAPNSRRSPASSTRAGRSPSASCSRWRGELDPVDAQAIDAYWVSAAEHGMNASTFTARVVASTGADAPAALSRRDRRALGPAARRRARPRAAHARRGRAHRRRRRAG